MLTAQPFSAIGVPLIPATGKAPAGVETTFATVLCADLHGYGALVEKLPVARVVALLEQYFGLLTGTVLEWSGEVLRLGESDMLVGFGVGDCRHSRIYEAIDAARTIQDRFAMVRATWQSSDLVDASVGIGIDRGEVAVGIFGPPRQGTLSLVGDAVNLAAQLCRRARGGEILMSATVAAVQPGSLLHLPKLQLRGRRAPVEAWCAPITLRPRMRHDPD